MKVHGNKAVFLTRQNLIFPILVFDFIFVLDDIFSQNKILELLLLLGSKETGGRGSWYTYDYELNNYKIIKLNKLRPICFSSFPFVGQPYHKNTSSIANPVTSNIQIHILQAWTIVANKRLSCHSWQDS